MSSVPISEEDLKKEMEELKEELQCAVCLDILKKPVMILPCLHSFCSPCIQAVSETSAEPIPEETVTGSKRKRKKRSLTKKKKKAPPKKKTRSEDVVVDLVDNENIELSCTITDPFKCPVCRHEVNDLEGGKGGVQRNTFLDSQVDRLEELRKTLEKSDEDAVTSLTVCLCDTCKTPKKKEASVRCEDCKKNLCVKHQKYHKEFLPDHNVLDINEASSSSSSLPLNFSLCHQHLSEKMNLMCLKCEVPICSFCLVDGDHKGHEASSIFKFIINKKEEFSELVKSVEERHKDLDMSLSLIDLMETKIQELLISQKEKILKEMDLIKTKAIQQIEERQEELLDELETNSKEKLDRLAQQRKQLEADQSCLENSVKVSRSFLKNASDDQLSSHLHLLSDQLTRLKEDKNLLQPPVGISFLELDEIQSINLDDLLKGIKLVEKEKINTMINNNESLLLRIECLSLRQGSK